MNLQVSIQVNNAAFSAAVARGDSASIADVYTKHGAVLSINRKIICGKAAIQLFWRDAVQGLGIRFAELATVELAHDGNTAYEVGKYTLRGEWAFILEQGKYMVIWKEEEGQWKWQRNIFNRSLPTAGQSGKLAIFQS